MSWLLVFAVAVPVGYVLLRFIAPDLPFNAFVDDMMGNLFATVIGLITGVPIALEINRRQQEAQNTEKRQSREQEAYKRNYRLLSLLKNELEYDRDLLQKNIDQLDGRKTAHLVIRLKTELWLAVSYGGEFRWINDLTLVNIIADAYFYLVSIIRLQESFSDGRFFTIGRVIRGIAKVGSDVRTIESAVDLLPITLTAVQIALKAIDEALANVHESQVVSN